MPDDFDVRSHHYFTESGRRRTRAEVRGFIDQLTDKVKRQAKRLAVMAHNGTITQAEFEASMRTLLRSGHVIAASVGRGGRVRMTAKDWGRVGAKIKWQYKFLAKFARKIGTDAISGAASSNRVQLYADALHISYYRAFYSEMAESPKDKPIGKDGKELMVKLMQNSKEGCEDCEADAAMGWMRLDEMGLLGTRICGDFCKCDLVFSDDE
jgi:hypothetical protein